MSEFKINEKHLEEISNKTREIIEFFNKESSILSNKDEDIFIRYIAYLRLKNVIFNMVSSIQNFKEMVFSGHLLHHPFFHTEKYKENGWDEIDLGLTKFLCSEKEDKDKPGH